MAKDRMDVFELLREEASEADLDFRREELRRPLHRPRLRRGAGAREGDWTLRIVESDDLREVGVVQSVRTERHLLRPFDVLVTALSKSIQAALVPPTRTRTSGRIGSWPASIEVFCCYRVLPMRMRRGKWSEGEG